MNNQQITNLIYGNSKLDEIIDYIEKEISLSQNGKLSEAQREQAKERLEMLFASIEAIPADDD